MKTGIVNIICECGTEFGEVQPLQVGVSYRCPECTLHQPKRADSRTRKRMRREAKEKLLARGRG